ncbi:ParB/RepB/Spo0J family partition protein [Pseudobacteroides cellulosolvens]|uniref:ParB-like partition protein n=1 Tax=Pseudobacteroides cellulosolvens ATCC 35603 = DSM 2933 TaxID=398512 RepID=A0A0L6JVA7_9FIRM|nr:ParB/RepB/Spo0J family partition protein [Pseudobacteroides cellulosolvens]KNY29748.1 parB-like partition protein [Pseudobacteroides cellulosolvens ATCC 35603 = DSM 2933]
MIKKGLGKGLGALIDEGTTNEDKGIMELKINEIEPNKGQPRKYFDDDKLTHLAESIKQHGIVQPIIVKNEDGVYRIVAGERRWRAARIAGLTKVPVLLKELSNKQVMEIALIENIQREDLNPIEEAEAFEKLIKEYNMTQDEVASVVGKSRSAIANTIRLLHLNTTIKEYLINGSLSSGHARALLSIDDEKIQEKVAEEIKNSGLNVRDTEKLVKKYLTKKKTHKENNRNDNYNAIEERLKDILGTKVQIVEKNKKGKIMIEYYSLEELDRIIEMVEVMSTKKTTS